MDTLKDFVDYINSITIETKDDKDFLEACQDHVKMTQLISDDPWLARQGHFGYAGAMQSQIQYIGSTLLPSVENRITRAASTGVRGEDLVIDHWFGTTNSSKDHENDELPGESLDNDQIFRDGLLERMKNAAVQFVCHMKAHDELSDELGQMKYFAIKQKGEASRQAREKTIKASATRAAKRKKVA